MFRSIQNRAAPRSHDTTAPTANPIAKPVKRIKSQDLLQQINEVEIDHEGRIYRLRLTQLNKLILTA